MKHRHAALYSICVNLNMCKMSRSKIYNKTISGVASKMYGHQKQSSKIRGHEMPRYTRDELLDWLLNHPDFFGLFNVWVESGHKTEKKPSIDRIDDYKGYSFDNIKLTTYEENRNRYYRDAKIGVNTKACKSVIKLTLRDEVICEYHSLNFAARENNLPIGPIFNVCDGKHTTSGGYKWKWK